MQDVPARSRAVARTKDRITRKKRRRNHGLKVSKRLFRYFKTSLLLSLLIRTGDYVLKQVHTADWDYESQQPFKHDARPGLRAPDGNAAIKFKWFYILKDWQSECSELQQILQQQICETMKIIDTCLWDVFMFHISTLISYSIKTTRAKA